MTTTEMVLPVRACPKCSHSWVPRQTTPPKRCPRCKAPYTGS